MASETFETSQTASEEVTWIKLSDSVPDHDRIVRAGDRAAWLWVCGLCWSSRHLADGKLPYDVIPRLGGHEDGYELAEKLVTVGLWRRTKTGFSIHNYAKFQRTKTQVERERETGRERQSRKRLSRRDAGVTHGDVTEPEKSRDREEPPNPPTKWGAKEMKPIMPPTLTYCPRCKLSNFDCDCPPLAAVPDPEAREA